MAKSWLERYLATGRVVTHRDALSRTLVRTRYGPNADPQSAPSLV